MSRTFRTVLIVVLAAIARPVVAQDVEYQRVDGIAAVVGERIITLSRLEERINVLRATGVRVPTEPQDLADFRRAALQQMIDEALWVMAAERDTLVRISPEQVQSGVDERFAQVRQGTATQSDFDAELQKAGFNSTDEYRRYLTEQVRINMLTEAIQQILNQTGAIRQIYPTAREVRDAFESMPEQERSVTVTFRQIIITAQPDSAAAAEALVKADSLYQRVRRGEDFAELARQHSQDPGTAGLGGELGWFRRGIMAPAFERAVFALRPGQISPPVRTTFGYHVIQLQRTDAGERRARHILVRPTITDAQKAEARARADSIALALRNGVSYDSLVRFHDVDEERLGNRIGMDRLQEVAPTYVPLFENSQPGDILGPVTLPREGIEKYAIIVFEDRLGKGEFTFDEVRDNIRQNLARQNGMTAYLNALKSATFIDIRIATEVPADPQTTSRR